MDVAIVVAIVSAVVAFASALLTLWGQAITTIVKAELDNLRLADQRRFDANQKVTSCSEPVARAAYDLQSRYNIVHLGGSVDRKYVFRRSDDRDQRYVIDYIAFVVAQYFAWTEIVRRDVQYIDLGVDAKTRNLRKLLDRILASFQADSSTHSNCCRVFAGEQRAIGQTMIIECSARLDCIDYATFPDRLAENTL